MSNLINIDWEEVRRLAMQGYTGLEIAKRIGVHYQTLYARFAKECGMTWADFRAQCRKVWAERAESKLMEKVEGGDVACIIFACKAYAGLSDRQTVEHVQPQPLEIRIVGAPDDAEAA